MPAATIRAPYGAATSTPEGVLPQPFPRTMGPNCAAYLQEVIDSGLTSDMIGRFEAAFATELGVRHCIATPGCTPALAILAAAGAVGAAPVAAPPFAAGGTGFWSGIDI